MQAPQPATLPVRSHDVLAGMPSGRATELEVAHGNRDFVRILDLFGIGGELRPLTPWEAEDEEGRHLVLAGSYAASPFGEAYEPLMTFLRTYLDGTMPLAFPQQTVSAWRAAVETNLVALLAAAMPSHVDSRVLFSNSGAEAVEAAIKLARAARPRATTFVNFVGAYHGKTFGALSLTPSEAYQAPFRPLMGPVRTLPYGDLEALDLALREIGPDKVTAIVIEPIQGEAGIVVPPEGFLREVGEIARRHGILVIADEIQSGLGRTGHWFASTAGGLDPDIVTLAKPLGGGLVPVGATIVRHEVFSKMQSGTHSKRHSNTFGGGSLAMAVALRSLEIIHDEGLVEKARADGAYGLERLRAMQAAHPAFIESVRGAGMLFGIQVRTMAPPRLVPMDPELLPILSSLLFLRALHRDGVHACFSQNSLRVVRFTPALTMPREVLSTMFDRVERVLETHSKPWRMLMTVPPKTLAQLARIAL
ncbi:MAG: aspartate aminotransferase family protein [Trueperaceae bacterium]|nr:aspartate aminotransferase family protein [Trueperaceae bacterium]